MAGPSSVERVLARMRESGDFPAMATTVGQITRLIRSYGVHFAAIDAKIDALIGGAVVELKEHSKTFNLDLPGSAFVHGLGEWRIESLVSTGGKEGIAAASVSRRTHRHRRTRSRRR